MREKRESKKSEQEDGKCRQDKRKEVAGSGKLRRGSFDTVSLFFTCDHVRVG